MTTRDDIYTALFDRVGSATFGSPVGPGNNTTWVTTSRRLKLWGDVLPDQQPAMFLTEHDEKYDQTGRGRSPRRMLPAKIWCYARCDGGLVGSQILDVMMAAIEGVLAPDDKTANVMTLGGLVYNCWIEGVVIKEPGDLDDQALMIVPINIMWP